MKRKNKYPPKKKRKYTVRINREEWLAIRRKGAINARKSDPTPSIDYFTLRVWKPVVYALQEKKLPNENWSRCLMRLCNIDIEGIPPPPPNRRGYQVIPHSKVTPSPRKS